MKRRQYLRIAGVVGTVTLGGCISPDEKGLAEQTTSQASTTEAPESKTSSADYDEPTVKPTTSSDFPGTYEWLNLNEWYESSWDEGVTITGYDFQSNFIDTHGNTRNINNDKKIAVAYLTAKNIDNKTKNQPSLTSLPFFFVLDGNVLPADDYYKDDDNGVPIFFGYTTKSNAPNLGSYQKISESITWPEWDPGAKKDYWVGALVSANASLNNLYVGLKYDYYSKFSVAWAKANS